ncbi:MAG: replication restart helicase PriA [Planctomycetota bacterium]
MNVALRLPVKTEFTYRLPPGMHAAVGNRVRVPFRGRDLPGVVVAVAATSDLDPEKLRDVAEVLDQQVLLPPTLLALARRMASEYGCSLGEALDAELPAVAKKRGARRVPCVELKIPHDLAQTAVLELETKRPAQSRVLRAVLEFGAPMPIRQVKHRTGTSDSPWQTLVKHGMLKRVAVRDEGEELVPAKAEATARHDLNEQQQAAVDEIQASLDADKHDVFLLHGVTGSGKTEVYLRALEHVRAKGRSGIVLVPEIALTPQTVGRFAARFPDVAVLHSGLTDAQRAQQWQRLVDGKAHVAIGARSALFAPLHNVGMIVLDEEHEGTFKQENTPRYHARAMAIARGEIENAVVVLGSATPSLESYGRARRGVYRLLTLPERAGQGKLPRILVEDLRKEDKDSLIEGVLLSRTLQNLIRERLDARDQVILFLNRRGFAPVLICPTCGATVKCHRCDISLTWHVRRGRMICHYCCEEQHRPELCTSCDHGRFHELGCGTERVEVAIKSLYPNAVVARMDADTMASRGAHERVLAAFRRRDIDVLIGTQMIAKGLDFPDVTLVGVISADTGLFLPDYRAAERTFQLLYQVAGRAGRSEKPGLVVFQTLCPDNYAVENAARLDYERFVQQELAFRKATGYPPFSRMVRVLVEGHQLAKVNKTTGEIRDLVDGVEDLQTLGPAPAILSKIKHRHRVHCLIKCFTDAAFQTCMTRLDDVESKTTQTMRVILDVDPGSVM